MLHLDLQGPAPQPQEAKKTIPLVTTYFSNLDSKNILQATKDLIGSSKDQRIRSALRIPSLFKLIDNQRTFFNCCQTPALLRQRRQSTVLHEEFSNVDETVVRSVNSIYRNVRHSSHQKVSLGMSSVMQHARVWMFCISWAVTPATIRHILEKRTIFETEQMIIYQSAEAEYQLTNSMFTYIIVHSPTHPKNPFSKLTFWWSSMTTINFWMSRGNYISRDTIQWIVHILQMAECGKLCVEFDVPSQGSILRTDELYERPDAIF